MAELHNTPMGKKLIEHDIPEISRQLSRIANSLEKIVDEKESEQKDFEEKKENIQKIKAISITDLGLNNRVINVLKGKDIKADVNNLYDIAKLKISDFDMIRGWGSKCQNDLKKTLESYNLWLGMSDNDIINTKLNLNK